MKGVLCFLCSILILVQLVPPITGDGSKPSSCNGSIASCQLEDEFLMDSDTHRRFLQQERYIDYATLQADKQVCDSGRFIRYANCVPAMTGNSPSRGCNTFDDCRVDCSNSNC